MYTLEKKIVFQILPPICILLLIVAQASAITLSELQQIVKDTQKSVTTAHLVYISDFNDNYPIAGSDDDLRVVIRKVNKHELAREDRIIDLKTKRVNSFITDLRDLDVLLKRHNLPAEQKINVSLTKAVVIQDTYEMGLVDSYVTGGPARLDLCERPGKPLGYMAKVLSFGVIDAKLLSQANNPTLTEFHSDGKALLRIQLTIKRQDANVPPINVKIECDPSLSYRFYRIEKYIDGVLLAETIADDYRIVNGVPYPFLYIERRLDENGKILRKIKYVIEYAKFGVDLSAKDFKLLIPDGTIVTDAVLSMTTFEIEKAGYMGIDDVLSIAMKHR